MQRVSSMATGHCPRRSVAAQATGSFPAGRAHCPSCCGLTATTPVVPRLVTGNTAGEHVRASNARLIIRDVADQNIAEGQAGKRRYCRGASACACGGKQGGLRRIGLARFAVTANRAASFPEGASARHGQEIRRRRLWLTVEFSSDPPALTPEAARAVLRMLLEAREKQTREEPSPDADQAPE